MTSHSDLIVTVPFSLCFSSLSCKNGHFKLLLKYLPCVDDMNEGIVITAGASPELRHRILPAMKAKDSNKETPY